MSEAPVKLTVAGKDYAGWQTVRVTRSIETISGSFDLGVTEKWQTQGERWPIGEGDPCVVSIEGVPLITGYIDERELGYSVNEHGVSVRGRDKTGDLIDCSANLGLGSLHAKWEFRGIGLLQFAKKLCEPFKIGVSLQPGLVLPAPAPITAIEPGESAFSALERSCKIAGVLPVNDGNGGIVLTRSGKLHATSSLVEGSNILSARATFKTSERFRKYVVLSQHRGTDEDFGEAVSAVAAISEDAEVSRAERILLVRPEGPLTPAQAKQRAQWEVATRRALSDTVTVTVQGWTQLDGSVWQVNTRAYVRSPEIAVDGEMLITSATYTLTKEAGTLTELVLRPPEAFDPLPVPQENTRWKEAAGL